MCQKSWLQSSSAMANIQNSWLDKSALLETITQLNARIRILISNYSAKINNLYRQTKHRNACLMAIMRDFHQNTI